MRYNAIKNIRFLLRKYIIPRIVFLPYWIAWLVSLPIVFLFALIKRNHHVNRSAKICIEAGVGGWNIIEYKELYESALEYTDNLSIERVVIENDRPYLTQVYQALHQSKPTHYAYSPRTGAQSWLHGLFQAFSLLFVLSWHGIIPIVFLTDLAVRRWRAQSAIVTAHTGIVVGLMLPRIISSIFPHRRIIGPYIMPFSVKTMTTLAEQKAESSQVPGCNPLFTGSLYEPRTTKLLAIREGLEKCGIKFDIKGRIDGVRISDQEYWSRMISAPIVVTTADQVDQSGADWPWLQHFIYRYLEVMVCGSLLVAPELPGISRYFQAGIHYVSYDSIDEAIDKIAFYCENDMERIAIAEQGQARAGALITTRSFWSGIDIALGRDSLT